LTIVEVVQELVSWKSHWIDVRPIWLIGR